MRPKRCAAEDRWRRDEKHCAPGLAAGTARSAASRKTAAAGARRRKLRNKSEDSGLQNRSLTI